MDRLNLLFEVLATEVGFTPARIRKYKKLVEDANKARASGVLDFKLNQYDKVEEILTFYVFAPMLLREKSEVVEEILKNVSVNEKVNGNVNLAFEKQFKPPVGYLEWLSEVVSKHPVNYIRKQGMEHVKKGRRLEANTHIDAVFESDNLLILIEVKFTSDISYDVTFNPIRNQLVRNIDVGIEAAKKKGKKLVVLLCSPAELYHKKSRLYYYKIQEYTDFNKISVDIEWRPYKEIKEHLLKVGWIPLEKVIEIIYQNLESPEIEQAKKFFRERDLTF